MNAIRIINARDAAGSPFECIIRNGLISLNAESVPGETVVDARECVAFPGIVDMHVHLRDPWEDGPGKAGETIGSGTRAALNGGVVSCACMPNTYPPADSPDIIRYIIDKAREAGGCRVYPIGAITRGRNGEELVDFEEMLENGAVGFSDDGTTLMDPLLMEMALEVSRVEGFPVITHSLDETGFEGWVFNDGPVSRRYDVPGIPDSAEYSIVERDIEIARRTGGFLHVAHVSARETVTCIERAKQDGVNVTCEVTPHHLVFSEESITEPDSMLKMSPPLRSEADREALIEGVVSGVIDVIASDHAPHPASRKGAVEDAAFGVTGIETMLFAVLTELASKGICTMECAVERMCECPARILNIESGSLKEGASADILLIDPDEEWECTESFFVSQSLNSPFIGRAMRGRIVRMYVQGREVANAF